MHTQNAVEMIREMDPTRLINPASGWDNVEIGDIMDVHSYSMPSVMHNMFNQRASVCGETGGYSLKVPGHMWDPEATAIYMDVATAEVLTDKLVEINESGLAVSGAGLCAIVYTQITDVETELNGFYTYDRISKLNKVQKTRFKAGVDLLKVRASHHIVPTALSTDLNIWRYLPVANGARGWNSEMDFDDSAWMTGASGFGAGSPPGSRIRTTWDTPDIIMRRKIYIPALSETELETLQLVVHHDDDLSVYINGVLAASVNGYTASYKPFKISDKAKEAINFDGMNLFAVKCTQKGGGQYIDLGLMTEIAIDEEIVSSMQFTEISDAESLNDIRNNLDGFYILTADIDLSGYDNFEAIGTAEKPFRGYLNGNNHVIRNLKIMREAVSAGQDNQGLFGYAHGAIFSNFELSDPHVEGADHVGALIGTSKGSTVEQVVVTYPYVSGNNQVGGFIGRAEGGSSGLHHPSDNTPNFKLTNRQGTLTLEAIHDSVNLWVYDVSGNLLNRLHIQNQAVVSLPAGVYILKAVSTDAVCAQKIVVGY